MRLASVQPFEQLGSTVNGSAPILYFQSQAGLLAGMSWTGGATDDCKRREEMLLRRGASVGQCCEGSLNPKPSIKAGKGSRMQGVSCADPHESGPPQVR